MKTRAGLILAGVFSLVVPAIAASAAAEELSEKAVTSFMDYAWSLTPQQFSSPDGKVIQIDKKKRDDVMVPVEIAREVIMAGRLSAHAQVCDLKQDQVENHRALLRREAAKSKWSPQQMVYINQLHLTTIMLLTGKIKLIEKQGDKQVVVEEGKAPAQTCTDEQRAKVKELITTFVAASPKAPSADAASATAGGAPQATGSTTPVSPAEGFAAAAQPAAAAAKAAAAQPGAATPAPVTPAASPDKK